MTLASLKKIQANRVLGIDASTNSIAFCLMENDIPLKWGKIDLVGQDIYEKIYNAKLRMNMMLKELKSDYIAVEGAILVRSPDAVIKLSYVYFNIYIFHILYFRISLIQYSVVSYLQGNE